MNLKRPRIRKRVETSKSRDNTLILSSDKEYSRVIKYTPKRTFGKHYKNNTTF